MTAGNGPEGRADTAEDTALEWAKTTIVVYDESGDAAETVALPGTTLEEQLQAAEDWLRRHEEDVEGHGRIEHGLRLFASWAPAEGQHALTLPETLVAALARVEGHVWMDVYPHDQAPVARSHP